MRSRRLAAALVILAALCATVPGGASANPPTKITIIAVFNPITFGESAFINGGLQGGGQEGQQVALEQSPPPYTDWTPTGLTAIVDSRGYYTFMFQPDQTMRYRATSQGVTSTQTALVAVAPRITMSVKALRGWTLRFSGNFGPRLDGQTVAIQRRTWTGGWATMKRAALNYGTAFLGRLQAKHPITLRAFYAGDATHRSAASRAVTIKPLPPKPKRKKRG